MFSIIVKKSYEDTGAVIIHRQKTAEMEDEPERIFNAINGATAHVLQSVLCALIMEYSRSDSYEDCQDNSDLCDVAEKILSQTPVWATKYGLKYTGD